MASKGTGATWGGMFAAAAAEGKIAWLLPVMVEDVRSSHVLVCQCDVDDGDKLLMMTLFGLEVARHLVVVFVVAVVLRWCRQFVPAAGVTAAGVDFVGSFAVLCDV